MIAITIFVLLIVGVGAFMMMQKPQPQITKQSANTNTPQTANSGQETATTQLTTLKNLMTTGGTQKCTYIDSATGSSGSMYIEGGKMRGDFMSSVNGSQTGSHMISDGQYVYVWTDTNDSGFKMSVSAMEEGKSQTNSTAQQYVDMNKKIEYSCAAWSADASMFTVPADKKFQDMSVMMQNAGKMMKDDQSSESGAPTNQDACAACDSAPAEAQAQCRAALKCN